MLGVHVSTQWIPSSATSRECGVYFHTHAVKVPGYNNIVFFHDLRRGICVSQRMRTQTLQFCCISYCWWRESRPVGDWAKFYTISEPTGSEKRCLLVNEGPCVRFSDEVFEPKTSWIRSKGFKHNKVDFNKFWFFPLV
jgi:hypothetical protein